MSHTPTPAERTKEWRIVNPEKVRAQKARYNKKKRLERREEHNAKRRATRARNPHTQKSNWEERKLWLASGDVTAAQMEGLVLASNGRCTYCGEKVKTIRCNPLDPRGFDHKVSRANGGAHTYSNLTVCCRRCNELKGGR